jgi:outer membrane protein assembly factor BamB
VVYVCSGSGTLYALNASTGAVEWTFAGNSGFTSPVVANGVVYTSSGQTAYALNALTGAKLWSLSTHTYVDSSLTVANGKLYFAIGGVFYAFGLPKGSSDH